MNQMTKHPLYAAADVLKRAFILNGFSLYDDCGTPEALPLEKTAQPFEAAEEFAAQPIGLAGGKYALRTGLLFSELAQMRSPLPVKKILCGKIYDQRDARFPDRLRIEGVLAERGMAFRDYQALWNKIIAAVYGITARGELEALGGDSYRISAVKDGGAVAIGCTGPATWLAKALLDTDCGEISTWAFSVDVDTVALDMFHIGQRAELYGNAPELLRAVSDDSAAVGDTFGNRVSDLLRRMGYARYTGMRLYPADIYKKMNMIQESWDSNNRGVGLAEPLNGNTGLPTVLTPAAEQALADSYKAGAETARLFDVGHIFLPAAQGGAPVEKTAISICAYGPEVNSKSFKAEMVSFLKQLGVSNHFFFPTNLAIAYDTKDTWLLLDEKMKYLEGNFGGVSHKAEENFGIGVHAFMANFELAPLEEKSAEEFAFTPPETR